MANSLNGLIVKGIGGFYYVDAENGSVYECRARGIFRKEKQKPAVGDNVSISIIDEADKTGSLDVIHPRKTMLIRPMVANVTQAVIVFAAAAPTPNIDLLDRFLVMAEEQGLKVTICINKTDLDSERRCEESFRPYKNAGYRVIYLSAEDGVGIDELRAELAGEVSVFAGPSGVGKSSLINALLPMANMETGELSLKIERGKHTTRHASLIKLDNNAFIVDSPGFTSLFLDNIEKEDLQRYFREFEPFIGLCRFVGCSHVNEPDCAIKNAIEAGTVDCGRYKSYVSLYNEINNKKKEWKK